MPCIERQKRAIRPKIRELSQSTRHYSMHGKIRLMPGTA
jgi:hypothetical protein